MLTLNFYINDPLSDSIHGKPGGLGIHFERTTDIEKYSAVYVDTDLDGVADSDIVEQASPDYGSLRVYNDASLLLKYRFGVSNWMVFGKAEGGFF